MESIESKIRIDEVISIIKKAGKIINYNFRHNRDIEKKGQANYVTDLDKKIENFIIVEIKKIYPGSIFVSEESSPHMLASSYWVLDPIDGTTNLLHGYKSVCISLGYVENNEVKFGIVYCPTSKELFYAKKDEGAYLIKGNNKQRIYVNDNASLENSLIGFGCPYDKAKVPFLLKILEKILIKCDDIKRLGPASLDICYVACGRLSAYIELDLETWDFLAGSLILKEAGGKIYNFSGESIGTRKTHVIASNPQIVNEIIKLTKDFDSNIYK